jgi:hypothetical protein
MSLSINNRRSEAGSAQVKLVAILAALFLVGYAAYNYIPIAYEGESFKQDMQTAVVQGMATPPGVTMSDLVKGKLQKAMTANNIPTDAVVQITQTTNSVQAHVIYSKQVRMLPFGLYKYNYNFDHTATPTGFLMKQ